MMKVPIKKGTGSAASTLNKLVSWGGVILGAPRQRDVRRVAETQRPKSIRRNACFAVALQLVESESISLGSTLRTSLASFFR